MIFYLQITVLLCLIYSFKTSMYRHNILGVIVLLTFGFNTMIIDACNKTLAISLVILSIFIVIYDFIKGIKRCINTSLALS